MLAPVWPELHEMLASLARNKWRSFLTVFGMVIGAGSLVLLSGLLMGGQEVLRQTSQETTGADIITVRHADVPLSQRKRTQRSLEQQDQTALSDSLDLKLRTVQGTLQVMNQLAVAMGRKQRVMLFGASPQTLDAFRVQLRTGRFLDESDLLERRRVCVVGFGVWQNLLAAETDLSRAALSIAGVRYQVVGVLDHKPTLGKDGLLGITWDGRVLVPVSTLQIASATPHRFDRLFLRLPRTGASMLSQLEPTRRMARGILLRRHYGVENFSIDSDREARQQEEAIILVIHILTLCMAGMAMTVGGINIMNIMLVAVEERTREIGLRRALGATRWDILRQFLIESALLAGVGGVAGVVGGLLLTFVTSRVLALYLGTYPAHYSGAAIGLGLLSTTLFGLLFGVYPALRAARLDPVLALRTE